MRLVEPDLVAECKPLTGLLEQGRILQRSADTNRNDGSVGMTPPELLDLLTHPTRVLQRTLVRNDYENPGAVKGLEQGAVELLARRRLVFTEKYGEVALSQAPSQVRCVTVRPAR